MAREFIAPGNIFTGAGALDMAEDKLSQLGKKALIVTDNVMVELGNCAKVEAALKNGNVDYVVYHEINGEPTDVMINKGLELYKENGCDFLVALGGGSPIDSMKAIAALVANGGNISDYMGKIIGGELPTTVAIPTTAGTGSEATQFTIITDTQNDVKRRSVNARLCDHRSTVYNDCTTKDHSSNRIRCTDTCSRSVYIQTCTAII